MLLSHWNQITVSLLFNSMSDGLQLMSLVPHSLLSLRISLGWSVLDEPFCQGRSAVMHYIEKHFHQSDRLCRGVELLLSLWDDFSVWWIGSYSQSVITELLLHAREFVCKSFTEQKVENIQNMLKQLTA